MDLLKTPNPLKTGKWYSAFLKAVIDYKYYDGKETSTVEGAS